MENVSVEFLKQVFDYFGPKEWLRFAQVCQKWNYVANLMWLKERQFCLYRFNKSFQMVTQNSKRDVKIELHEIRSILQKIAPHLIHATIENKSSLEKRDTKKHVSIDDHKYHTYMKNNSKMKIQFLQILANSARNLETFKVGDLTRKEVPIVIKIIQQNKHLKCLKIGQSLVCLCKYQNRECNHLYNELLLSIPYTLEHLKINFENGFIPDIFYEIVLKQRYLKKIHVTSSWFLNKIVEVLIELGDQLDSICLERVPNIDSTEPEYVGNEVDDASFISENRLKTLACLNELEKLHLSGFLPVTDDVVLSIVHHCIKIQHLKLGRNNFTDETFEAIANMPSLRILDLSFKLYDNIPITSHYRHLNINNLCYFISASSGQSQVEFYKASHDLCKNTIFKLIDNCLEIKRDVVLMACDFLRTLREIRIQKHVFGCPTEHYSVFTIILSPSCMSNINAILKNMSVNEPSCQFVTVAYTRHTYSTLIICDFGDYERDESNTLYQMHTKLEE